MSALAVKQGCRYHLAPRVCNQAGSSTNGLVTVKQKLGRAFRVIKVTASAVIASIKLIAYRVLLNLSNLFGLNDLCKKINRLRSINYDKVETFQELVKLNTVVVSKANNTTKTHCEFEEAKASDFEVFQKIYPQACKNFMDKSKKLNDCTQSEKVSRIFNYTLLEDAIKYREGGYCLGGSLDFASRYLKEIDENTPSYEAVQKVSRVFKKYVPIESTLSQLAEFSYTYVNDEAKKKYTSCRDIELMQQALKAKIQDYKTNSIKALSLDALEQEFNSYTSKILEVQSQRILHREIIPRAALLGLSSTSTKGFPLNKLTQKSDERSINTERLKNIRDFICDLDAGAYVIYLQNEVPLQTPHSFLLIKEKSGRCNIYDPNCGIFRRSKDSSAAFLLWFLDRYYAKEYGFDTKTTSDPGKLAYFLCHPLSLNKKAS